MEHNCRRRWSVRWSEKGINRRDEGQCHQADGFGQPRGPVPRTHSGIDELDRVLGGGLVPASAILVGGDPGLGNHPIVAGRRAIFRSGIKGSLYLGRRGQRTGAHARQRLGLGSANVQLGADTNLRNILTTMDTEKPDLVIIDSIQTMWADTVESAPAVCPKYALRPMN